MAFFSSGHESGLDVYKRQLFLCSENICLINKGGCLSPTTYPLFGRLRCNFDEFLGNGSRPVSYTHLLHTSIVTVANTAEFAITDIEDAPVGAVISLKCGSVDKGPYNEAAPVMR